MTSSKVDERLVWLCDEIISATGVTACGYTQTGDAQTMSISDLSFLPSAQGPSVRAVHDQFHGDLLEVSMGPQHPSTHGVFRLVATLDV